MREWEKNVRKVVPYVPGEQPKCSKMIKLNTNENPYPPAPEVLEALKELDTDLLRRYPDPTAEELVGAIADFYGLKKEQVFVGVGSDDVLAMLFLTFFNGKEPILFPDITYSFYDVWAEMLRIPYEVKPLDEKLKVRTEDYTAGAGKQKCGGIVLPNPNAPTGVLQPLSEIEEIVKCNRDVIVIVDEAYIDFGGASALPLIEKYDNLAVVQTFSKSRALAGMRVGYVMADPALIGYLNDVKYSFNSYTMNQTAIVLGAAAVRNRAYFEETCKKIVDTRERSKRQLKELGFEFEDSMSNFIFATHPKLDCVSLFETLRENNIYVRHFNRPERIKNYLRITVGTDEEMDVFFGFLKEYIAKQKRF